MFQQISSEIEEFQLTTNIQMQGNTMYQFLTIYQCMAIRLLIFIEASRSRDWLLHLSSAQDMLKDLISMDRIKYRRMMAVYIADMKNLEKSSPDVWAAFMDG